MAISFAAHRALTNLFPALADTFSTFLTTRLGYTAPVTDQPDDRPPSASPPPTQ